MAKKKKKKSPSFIGAKFLFLTIVLAGVVWVKVQMPEGLKNIKINITPTYEKRHSIIW